MIHEAILIPEVACLNSKAEYGGYKVARLTVETSAKEQKKALDDEDLEDIKVSNEIAKFKELILSKRADDKSSNVSNLSLFSRKRNCSEAGMDQISPVNKASRVSSKRGTWDPTRRVFTKKVELIYSFQKKI